MRNITGFGLFLKIMALLLMANGAQAAELQIGQTAPDFALPDETGTVRHLSEFRGRTVALMFYPKDFTPGCTCQARSVRSQVAPLKNRNIVVLGINTDTSALHHDFIRSEGLNYSLLSDTTKAVTKAYGVLGANGLPNRVTFIIGPDGAIHGIDGNVNAQFVRQGKTLISRHGENLELLFSDWKANVGASVPNFFLPDANGKTVSPRIVGKKASVIFAFDAKQPASRDAAERLYALATNPVYREVAFLGVSVNAKVSAADLQAFAQTNNLPFPLATDPYREVLGHLEAAGTPTVWVLNGEGKVAYRGAISSSNSGALEVNYVREALNAVLTGRPVPVTETPVSVSSVSPGLEKH